MRVFRTSRDLAKALVIRVANTTTQLPITTAYPDRAATAAAKGHLPLTTNLETGIGFL